MKPTWQGREVRFDDFDLKAGREVRAAFEQDRERGAFVLLAKSCRYVDTGELVFASADEIEALPYRLSARVMHLASLAAEANTIETVEGVENPT